MSRVVWAPQALDDVESIREYLSRTSADHAALVVELIVAAAGRLERHPRSGRVVPEVGEPSLREVIMRDYRIVYRLRRGVVDILTVFHGARLFRGA